MTTLKLVLNSTAILFGELDNFMIVLFQTLSLITLTLLSIQLEFTWPFYITLLLALTGFVRQYLLTRHRNGSTVLKPSCPITGLELCCFLALLLQRMPETGDIRDGSLLSKRQLEY